MISSFAAAAVALAGAGGPGPAEPGAAEVRQAPPSVVRVEWRMPRRYERTRGAWNPRSARYDRAYVHPRRWAIQVDLCGSTGGGRRIDRYAVRLEGVGFGYDRTVRRSRCRFSVRGLPRLGTYDLTATIAAGDLLLASKRERITLRDWLVVSLGDSMASGEGNPDRLGRYTFTIRSKRRLDWLWNGEFGAKEHRRVRWQDRRCHRSLRGGHALYARDLESSDPHSSVTFLSLACSGAKITTGLLERYAGQESTSSRGRVRDHRKLPAQVDALAAALRRSPRRSPGRIGSAGSRKVDALLLSVGVNDVHFSDVVRSCATNPRFHSSGRTCVTKPIGGAIETIGARYDRLGRALRDRLDVEEVYITDYPADPFNGGGCGLLGLTNIGITATEAQFMMFYGRHLNGQIRLAADRNGWNFLPGMTERLADHAYCDDPSHLVRVEDSLAHQGNVDGGAHPNRLGHRMLGQILGGGVVVGRQAFPHRRVTVTIEEIRIGRIPREDAGSARVELVALSGRAHQTRHLPAILDLAVPRLGEWTAVPAERSTFQLDVFTAPQPPRHATAFELLVRGTSTSGIAGAVHRPEAGLGAGRHEIADVQGRIAVRYRVDVATIHDQPVAAG